jgi:hypothetical protein
MSKVPEMSLDDPGVNDILTTNHDEPDLVKSPLELRMTYTACLFWTDHLTHGAITRSPLNNEHGTH